MRVYRSQPQGVSSHSNRQSRAALQPFKSRVSRATTPEAASIVISHTHQRLTDKLCYIIQPNLLQTEPLNDIVNSTGEVKNNDI